MATRCDACGKICYSQKEAMTQVHAAHNGLKHRDRNGRTIHCGANKIPCRAYYCTDCRCWHLTSQTERTKKRGWEE